jgi:GNAT superfamily N-acetyltransferase
MGEAMTWRSMQLQDLEAVITLGDAVHIGYPEDAQVAHERFRLFPKGCLAFDVKGAISGYCFSHPWMMGDAPKLNTLLVNLPSSPDVYYLHDLVVAPGLRAKGSGRAAVAAIKEVARQSGFREAALIAVNNSTSFWKANGFVVTAVDSLKEKLQSYDADARYMICQL